MALIKCPDCENMVSERAKVCIHCGAPLNIQDESLLIAKLVNFDYKYPLGVAPFDVVGLYDENNNKVLSFKIGQVQQMPITKTMRIKAYHLSNKGEKVTLFGLGEKTCSNELTIVPGKTQKIQINIVKGALKNYLTISFVEMIDTD